MFSEFDAGTQIIHNNNSMDFSVNEVNKNKKIIRV